MLVKAFFFLSLGLEGLLSLLYYLLRCFGRSLFLFVELHNFLGPLFGI
jgi:hypothetical protein